MGTLFFVNSNTTTFTNITTAAIQARWVAETLKHGLPSKEDMWAELREKQSWKRETMPNAGAARAYMIQTHQVHYYDELLKDMGASIRRKQGGAIMAAIREVFDPYRPRDFSSIITGEFKYRRGELARKGHKQPHFVKECLIVIAVLIIVRIFLRVVFSGVMAEIAALR